MVYVTDKYSSVYKVKKSDGSVIFLRRISRPWTLSFNELSEDTSSHILWLPPHCQDPLMIIKQGRVANFSKRFTNSSQKTKHKREHSQLNRIEHWPSKPAVIGSSPIECGTCFYNLSLFKFMLYTYNDMPKVMLWYIMLVQNYFEVNELYLRTNC